MAGWKTYFIISGCTRFVLPGIGEINASNDNMAISKLEKAYQRKCPYISLTKEGFQKYEPDKKPVSIEIKKIEIPKEPDKKQNKKFNAKKKPE